jgi:hypothetical protein
MPLVQRSIENNYEYGQKFIVNPNSKHRLQDTFLGRYSHLFIFVTRNMNYHVNSTAGSLEQLGLLADYAADIFKDLIEFSGRINHRIASATERSSRLAQLVTDATRQVDQYPHFLGTIEDKSFDKAREQYPETDILSHSTMPKIMLARYDSVEVKRMPCISECDKCASPDALVAVGGTLANRYSNPNFVKNEWIKKSEEDNKALEREREVKKAEKRAKKLKKTNKGSSAEQIGVTKKEAYNWKNR